MMVRLQVKVPGVKVMEVLTWVLLGTGPAPSVVPLGATICQ